MATMNISLPEAMKEWVEQQAATGRYSNSSDVVRDLIRREQVRAEKIANMQRLVDEGRASGVDPRSPDEIMADIRARVLREASTGTLQAQA
ncbi:MAG: type II toxin-antitoxin system ParD family antitoxin [Sphingomonas adhaesiva]|uniref:type II toxin-antitoxin system ParD family antitoxin n=1 Tax=Sphingomonas adhaesiva TaxID=28212 RepID=UPI002FF49C7C